MTLECIGPIGFVNSRRSKRAGTGDISAGARGGDPLDKMNTLRRQ